MLETFRGECQCCGQIIELELEHNPDLTASRKATMLCQCPEAKAVQRDYQDEVQFILRREKTLKESKEAIHKIFGKSEEEDHVAMPESIVDFLINASALVYDNLTGSLNISLPNGTKAKIARKKDGLKIERQNTDAEAIEI